MLPEYIDTLVHALPEPAMLVSSTVGRIFAINSAARHILGVNEGELSAIATNVDSFLDYLRLSADSREPLPGTLRIPADGEPRTFKCSACLLVRRDGDVPALVLVRFIERDDKDPSIQLSQTVTELREEIRRRHDAEERLRALHQEVAQRSDERFQLLVESVKDYAIFMLDPTGHIASWNAGAARIKGYAAHEIIGQHFSVFYPRADVEAGKCDYELEVAAREGRFEDESPRVRKDGTTFYANVVITAIHDRTGALAGFAKVTRDLTERKRHEQERIDRARAEAAQRVAELNEARVCELAEDLRKAKDRAEAITKVKDEFLATLSHELRTPLNAIVGWSRLLQTESVSGDQQKHALETIVRNALAQNRLIDDLLDVSRIITGKLRLDVEHVDVNHIASAAVDVVRPAADAKGVRLQLVFNPDAGYVLGDTNRLQQVLWNLLSNAVKFTPKDGRVHVTLRRQDSHVEIVITDTGSGIPTEFLPRVFNRFAQAEEANVSTRSTGGLGLGLAIVKHIVELHGGTVEAQSDGVGTGATFIVRLPITAMRRSLHDAPTLSQPFTDLEAVTCPSELDGLRVLVVDDEIDSLEIIKATLEHCKAIVSMATNTQDAFELLRANPKPDVIVSDIGMPGEDGYAFIQRVRALARENGGRIPALALTAFARAEDRRRALTAGFQNHATKPIEPQELIIVVANLAGRFL